LEKPRLEKKPPPPFSSSSRRETLTLILPLRFAEGEDTGGGGYRRGLGVF